MNRIKEIIKKFVPVRYHKSLANFKNLIFGGYATKSYSFVGEDMILRRVFDKKTKGFYVDVGAHHPQLYSNTYHFYRKGWKGINIDAMPGSMKLFKKIRPRDINLEVALFGKKQILTYYMFNDSALNGFSKEPSVEISRRKKYKIIDEIKMETSTLAEILDVYLPKNTEIDFLSVDIEGSEFQVLESNNWRKYRAKVILVESFNFSLSSPENCKIYRFLTDEGYYLFAKAVDTLIFINNSFKKNG